MQDNNDNGKTKIQDELMTFFEEVLAPYLGEEFGKVNGRLDNVEKDVAVLKNDVSVLKEDVSVLKEDVSVLKTDMRYVKNDIRDLKADMPSKKDYEAVKKLEKIHRSELSAFA